MKFLLYISAILLVVINCSVAFAPVSQQSLATSTTSLNMGFFDMFDKEKQAARREREERERDEQEELQRQILERRRNPEAMEEYEARVAVRRKLYMSGRDELAKDFEVMKDVPTEE